MADGRTVGFIGLGAMGAGMAWNVLSKGFPCIVHDLRPEAAAKHVAAGARFAGSVAELARSSDVVVTMLPDVPEVEAALVGPDGVSAHARPGTIVVDMSTIDPLSSRRIAEALAGRGLRMLDSPVGRGVDQAWAGALALMVGGDEALLAEVRPVLETMGDAISHCGPNGAGCAMKLVNNFLSAGIVATVAEAMAIGVRFGLPLEMMVEISGGTGTYNKWLHAMMPAKAFRGDLRPGFATRLALKDQRLAMTFGEAMGVPLKVGAAARDWLAETNADHPNDDFSTGLMQVMGAAAGGIAIRFADGRREGTENA